MDTNLLSTLQNYWLSEKEARVYLTVLELGISIASTIARRAELNRVTTYTLLEDLKRDGIVNETTKEGIKYYSVISPDILLKQLEQKYESFKEKIPELLALAEKFGQDKTKIQYFEWILGVKQVFNDFTNSSVPNKAFLWSIKDPEIHDMIVELANDYVKTRVRKKILFQRILSNVENVDIKQEKKRDKEYFRKTIVVADFPHQIKADITLYWPNKVAFIMWENKKPYAVTIGNEKMYQSILAIFDYIWLINTKK